MRWGIILACLALAGCETPYQETSIWGYGVSATRIDETRLQILAKGTDTDTLARMQQFVIRKAAEEAVKAGYVAFRVDMMQDISRGAAITLPGSSYTTAQVTGLGNTAFGQARTTYMPGQTLNMVVPQVLGLVTMLKTAPADTLPGYFIAADVVKYAAMSDRKK